MPKEETDYKTIMESFVTYIAEERPCASSPEDVANLMRPVFAGQEQEMLRVLLLDTKNRVVSHELVTIGLLDRSQAHAREVFRLAIRNNCAKVVLVHNHPSLDPTPSSHDIASTKSLVEAGKIVGIEVIDHVIIGGRTTSRTKDYVSLQEMGLM